MAGNFFATAQNLRLEDKHVLKGNLQRADGQWQEVEINLNEHIGNQNGHFSWDSAGFSDSAEDVRVSVEGEVPVFVLRARLRNDASELVDADLNLSERITNKDGNFGWA